MISLKLISDLKALKKIQSNSFCQECDDWILEKRYIYMLFAGWEVRRVKNCDRGLENTAAF